MGKWNLSNADSLYISFQYKLNIVNHLNYGGYFAFFQNENVLYSSSVLNTDNEYQTFYFATDINPAIVDTNEMKLRLIVLQNSLLLSVKDIQVFKK